MRIKRGTKAYDKALVQAIAEAKSTGEMRIVAETIYGVEIGTKAQLGGFITGMYRTFVSPDGTVRQ